jgi:chromosome segregation ATPase
MDEQTIKEEVLEAESIIRGLAQRMTDANAALQAAESAKQSLADARTALHGSSAQLENLSRMANESIRRVEEATQNLIQRTQQTLEMVTAESQSLREFRADLGAAARSATQAATAVSERESEVLRGLQTLSANLPGKVAEATTSATAELALEVKRAREASDALHAHLQHTRTEVQTGLVQNEETVREIKRDLQKLAVSMEATATSLNNRLQEVRVKGAAQTAAVESNVMGRVEITDTKVTWIIVLQIILTAVTVATAMAAAKLLMH